MMNLHEKQSDNFLPFYGDNTYTDINPIDIQNEDID